MWIRYLICCNYILQLTFAYYARDLIIIFNVPDVFFNKDWARRSLQLSLWTCIITFTLLILFDRYLLQRYVYVVHRRRWRLIRMLLYYLIHHDILLIYLLYLNHLLLCQLLLLLFLSHCTSVVCHGLAKSLIQVFVISLSYRTAT
mgnify:CR=1 FL=1